MSDVANNGNQWKQLGFTCGLEIHHQIITEKKLFCHCPAGHYHDTWHAEVLRHMRPTLSELGEYEKRFSSLVTKLEQANEQMRVIFEEHESLERKYAR